LKRTPPSGTLDSRTGARTPKEPEMIVATRRVSLFVFAIALVAVLPMLHATAAPPVNLD